MRPFFSTLFALVFSVFLFCCSGPSSPNQGSGEADKDSGDTETTSLFVLDLRGFNNLDPNNAEQMKSLWDTMHSVAALQGIVNRSEPKLYIKYVMNGSKDIDTYWWNLFRRSGEWLDGKFAVETSDVLKAFEFFRSSIDGLVAWDPKVPSTSNVASTVAGVENLIPVRWDPSEGSLYSTLTGMGFEVKKWLVNKDGSSLFHSKTEPYIWAIEHYLTAGKCSPEFAAYYIDAYWIEHASQAVMNHHCLTNHDFFIAKKAFFFDLSPWEDEVATDAPGATPGEDYGVLCQILNKLYELNDHGNRFCHIGGFPAWAFKYTRYNNVGGSHGEVDTEWKFAQIISAYNCYKDADAISYGAMANASFWAAFPLDNAYPQRWVSRDDLIKKGYLSADGKVNLTKKYFLYYVGDFDAASWLYQMVPVLWDNTTRGKVPMMWSISPALAYRVPMAMHYLRKTATENDYFAASNNGAGYLNPGMLQGSSRPISHLPSGVDQWASHNKPHYERWGLSVTGFVIDGMAEQMNNDCLQAYASFSPSGIVVQKCNKLAISVNGMPVLRAGPDINDSAPSTASTRLSSYLKGSHPSFPFYWARAILKSPVWYLDVKKGLEKTVPEAEWVDAPTFFELLRLYLAEGHDIPTN